MTGVLTFTVVDYKKIECDLDDITTITQESLLFALCRFITEVKKLDGSDFPARTLYDILICVQFHLETLGFPWKLINDVAFTELKFTLDNLMKQRTSMGIGVSVKKAQVLSVTDEEYLWSLGLLGTHLPDVLLNTVVFLMGKGFALHAGKEHQRLRSLPFQSQIQFMHDELGDIFIHYTEEIGLKTNKGGLKHRKVEPKYVDMYPISNISRCLVRIILKYLSKLLVIASAKHFICSQGRNLQMILITLIDQWVSINFVMLSRTLVSKQVSQAFI